MTGYLHGFPFADGGPREWGEQGGQRGGLWGGWWGGTLQLLPPAQTQSQRPPPHLEQHLEEKQRLEVAPDLDWRHERATGTLRLRLINGVLNSVLVFLTVSE